MMTRQFGDIPPLSSNVGIQIDYQRNSATFPDGTLELLASEYPVFNQHEVEAVYVLPETDELHVVRYQSVRDRHHGTILVRLYDTDDQRQDLVAAVNGILQEQGKLERVPNWAK